MSAKVPAARPHKVCCSPYFCRFTVNDIIAMRLKAGSGFKQKKKWGTQKLLVTLKSAVQLENIKCVI